MLLRAFAKINIDLRVGEKRPDGYHEIRTINQTNDWFDEIHIERSGRFQFTVTGGGGDESNFVESNLVVRAVRGFESAAGIAVAANIRLTKHIPIGAGLGGGSSDAAVTILGLQRFFDVSLPARSLWDLLRSLGSDVPFFAIGGCAAGIGRGDEVYPLNDDISELNHSFVLVTPRVSIATAEAYSWLTNSRISNNIEGFCAQFLSAHGRAERMNDFELPVFMRYGELSQIRDELLKVGAFHAALSGSGSVVFGQFRTKKDADLAASSLSPRYSVKVANPLGRLEYFMRMIET